MHELTDDQKTFLAEHDNISLHDFTNVAFGSPGALAQKLIDLGYYRPSGTTRDGPYVTWYYAKSI